METPASTAYALKPQEIQMLQQINLNGLIAKGKIYDLQVGLETARAELASAQQAMNGAVSVLAHANGLQNATLTPDFTRLDGVPTRESK